MRSTMLALVAMALALGSVAFGQEPSAEPSPGTPPIDCPLHAQGVDTHGMRPFEEVEEYIAFLERPERVLWQRPDEIVKALGLAGTEIVADVGAGSGYFTFRLAKALPEGRVRAIDIEPGMLRHIHHKLSSTGVTNIEVELVSAAGFELSDDRSDLLPYQSFLVFRRP